MKTSKRFTMVALAGILGLSAAVSSALAQGDTLVFLCYRNRTIQVPVYLLARYLNVPGTTTGPCQTTQ